MSSVRLVAVVMLVGCGAAGCATPMSSTTAAPAVVATIGDPASAQWTATTWEAVSTPKHRAVLEHAQLKTLVGEVVDVSCFLQLNKRGEAHIPCGQKCVRHGQPIGIVTDDGELYLVIPEEHHPRRDGQVNITERFAELMGKWVRVTGMLTSYHDYRGVFVRTLTDQR